MLIELERILSKNSDITDEAMSKAGALLINSQFIYRSGRHGHAGAYRLLERFPNYFSDLVAGIGRRWVHDDHAGFIGAIPEFRQFTWSKLETVLLCLLLLCFIDERDKIRIENGLATVNGGLLLDRYCQLTGKQKPKGHEVIAALNAFHRAGIVLLGELDPSCDLPFIKVSAAIMKIMPTNICQGIIESLGSDTEEVKV